MTIEMKAYEQCSCMVLRGRNMKFERFRVYCVLMKVCLSLPQHKRLQYRKIRYRKRELPVQMSRKVNITAVGS